MREIRLSATANADYQSCQRRYQLAYIFDLTADKDKDSTRLGGHWHRCHELLELKAGTVCPNCTRHEEIDSQCYVCGGTGYVLPDEMDRVARYLTQAYAIVPDNKTRDDWELERTILLYSLSGWKWLYAAEEGRWEVIESEIKFEVPVANPTTGRALSKVVFVGKIDRLVRDKNTGLVYVWERKSTSHSITSQDYWTALTQGDQISGYLAGGRHAQRIGCLRPYGIRPEDTPIAGAWCDVWHKPDIMPKKISKADLKMLVDTGEYCGTHITGSIPLGDSVIETAEMYGARLIQDIGERPEHYFAQREVSRTDKELEVFQARLFKLAKQIRAIEKGDLWVENGRSCENPFYCEFRPLCQAGVQVTPGTAPVGYQLKHPQAEEIPLE